MCHTWLEVVSVSFLWPSVALVADTVPAEIRSSSGLAHVSGGAHKYVTMGHGTWESHTFAVWTIRLKAVLCNEMRMNWYTLHKLDVVHQSQLELDLPIFTEQLIKGHRARLHCPQLWGMLRWHWVWWHTGRRGWWWRGVESGMKLSDNPSEDVELDHTALH